MIYPKKQFTHHRASNFCVVEKEKYKAILDTAEIGPNYNPGHAHADSLSFELSIGKSRMIVNSGISTYESNIDRHFQRGTSAHSTVEVEDTNSSDVWQSFRVGKRASIFDLKIGEEKPLAKISASHDGYNHLFKKCVHNRAWYFNEAFIRIRDTLIGRNVKSIARFYLHPQVEIEKQADNSILLVMPDSKCKLSVMKNNFQIVKSCYHRTFGFSEDNSCILVEITNNLSEVEIEILE
jgi:uncharacterized heparinase superfamily protein